MRLKQQHRVRLILQTHRVRLILQTHRVRLMKILKLMHRMMGTYSITETHSMRLYGGGGMMEINLGRKNATWHQLCGELNRQ